MTAIAIDLSKRRMVVVLPVGLSVDNGAANQW